jgi:hypothetical protein
VRLDDPGLTSIKSPNVGNAPRKLQLLYSTSLYKISKTIIQMPKALKDFEKELTLTNIPDIIADYKNLLTEVAPKIEGADILDLLKKLKRPGINKGPYPSVSIFEAANRIMTDLVIIYGAQLILEGKISGIPLVSKLRVDYGNQNTQAHDIIGKEGKHYLAGEAFNVAPSFFSNKKSSSIKKLLESEPAPSHLFLLCNDDSHSLAKKGIYKIGNVLIVPVEVKL